MLSPSTSTCCECAHTLSSPTGRFAVLFIDALQEYDDARRDREHFPEHLIDGGLVAFHDYDECCPGVMHYVDELLDAEALEFCARYGLLAVLRKPR